MKHLKNLWWLWLTLCIGLFCASIYQATLACEEQYWFDKYREEYEDHTDDMNQLQYHNRVCYADLEDTRVEYFVFKVKCRDMLDNVIEMCNGLLMDCKK